MKKLTIEHLAAYLPYGAKVVPIFGGYAILDVENIGRVLESDKPLKLILRPLSDLTREITHNGETYVPIERIHEQTGIDARILSDVFDDYMPRASYMVTKILHSWHFDTFGLIDSGLAIDINTMTK